MDFMKDFFFYIFNTVKECIIFAREITKFSLLCQEIYKNYGNQFNK